HSSRGQQAWEFWQKELAGELPVLELPTDRPRPAVQSFRTAIHTWQLPSATLAQLHTLAGEMGATVMPPLLAAYQLLLQRYTGQEELLVGVATAGRGRPEWERLVGYFLNQIVVRSRCISSQSFRQMVEATRERLYRGLEHQDCPFPEVVHRLSPRRDPSRS